MKTSPRTATLSLDLDNHWSYLKTHGDPEWERLPSYLDLVVPRILHFLKQRDLSITFFIVGQDAALDKNREAIASLAQAGHEIGNHTFSHEPWLHLYTPEQLEADFSRSEEHLERVTGQRPRGFRGPGFSLSRATLLTLLRRRYLYDATIFPTFIGPLGRAYFMMSSKLEPEERERRKALFGSVTDALRPNSPYRWELPEGSMLELPVTTMPYLKVPIHVSYILYLSTFSRRVAMAYFRTALELFRRSGVAPALLLHPLDFLGAEDVHNLSFFPGMNLAYERKLEIVSEVISLYQRDFTVLPLERFANALSHEHDLRTFIPAFAS